MPAQIFDSESEWVHSTIDETCIIEYGTRVTRKKDAGTTYPVYGGGGATFHMDSYNREDRMVVSRFAMSETCTRFVDGKFFLNDSGLTLKPKDEHAILPIFLDWLIHSLNDDIYSLGRGTAQKNLNMDEFRKLSIRYPKNISEQLRIVGILDEAFEYLENKDEKINSYLCNIRKLFQTSLDGAFANEHWNRATLEEILLVQPRNGWSPPAAYHSDAGTPVLTLSSVTGNVFRADQYKFTSAPVDSEGHYWVKNGDFLITRSNTPKLVGHVAIASDISTPTIYCDLIMRMNPDNEKVLTKFLYYQMRTTFLREEITRRAKGANPTMVKLNKGSVQSLPISFPSLGHQQIIIDNIEQLSQFTQELELTYNQELSGLTELRQSILQEAFSGAL